MNSKVACSVVLYNTDVSVIDNIKSYYQQVDKIYVIDNSETIDFALVKKITDNYKSVQYVHNETNMGIGYALNVAANLAIQEGFTYLLMMDDDSKATDFLVERLSSIAAEVDVGIVSPQSDDEDTRSGVVEVLTTITSGSILKLNAYVQAGPFMNELFIDWVDHEYCFRLQKLGFKVMQANDVKLKHRLGMKKNRLFAGFVRLSWRSHNPTRLYYKFRNSLFVLRLYRRQLPIRFMLYAYKELIEDFFKIVFFESNKSQYLELVARALTDLSRGRLGKLRQL